MKDYMKTCCDSMNGELIEFGGESDHVHLMVSVPTKIALCNFAGRLKGYSSYQIRKNFFNEIKHKLWEKNLWSPSYCAVSCGGAPLDLVRAYIEKQRTPSSNKSIRQSIQEKGRKGKKSRVKTSKKRRP